MYKRKLSDQDQLENPRNIIMICFALGTTGDGAIASVKRRS